MGTVHFRSIERRRTARVALCVDLIVHGERDSNGKFKAEARALSVCEHGGMMVLEPEVTIGQKLILINMSGGQKAECKVVSAKPVNDGKRKVAFEFTSAQISFWRMCFPKAGAKPIRRAGPALFGPAPSNAASTISRHDQPVSKGNNAPSQINVGKRSSVSKTDQKLDKRGYWTSGF
jgi:hypothetical protein